MICDHVLSDYSSMICDHVSSDYSRRRALVVSKICMKKPEHFYFFKLGKLADGKLWLRPEKRCSLHRYTNEDNNRLEVSEDEFKTYDLLEI